MYFINRLKFKVKNNFWFQYLFYKFFFSLRRNYYEIDFSILERLKINTYVDIGTNKGEYVNFLKTKAKKIYCFEPIRESYELLIKLFNSNKFLIKNIALGNKSKSLKINTPLYRNNRNEVVAFAYNQSSLIKKFKDSITQKVIVKRGDDLLLKEKKIDFIKIDVEGFELEVLKGLKQTIIKNFPILLIEIEHRHSNNFINTFKFLSDFNYKVYYVSKIGSLKKIHFQDLKIFLKKNQKINDLQEESRIDDFRFFYKRKKYICNFWFIRKDRYINR